MTVFFADVQQLLPMIDSPPVETPLGGVATTTLLLTDSARQNLYPRSLAQLLTLRTYALVDYFRYHQGVSQQLFLQSGVTRGAAPTVSQLLGLGDTAWHGHWELPQQTLRLIQTLVGTNTRAARHSLTLTQTLTLTVRRNLTVAQTLSLLSGSGGYNAQERCFRGYRVLSGPNSGGGA